MFLKSPPSLVSCFYDARLSLMRLYFERSQLFSNSFQDDRPKASYQSNTPQSALMSCCTIERFQENVKIKLYKLCDMQKKFLYTERENKNFSMFVNGVQFDLI